MTASQADEKWTLGLTADPEYRPPGFRINTFEENGVTDLSAASSDGGVCQCCDVSQPTDFYLLPSPHPSLGERQAIFKNE